MRASGITPERPAVRRLAPLLDGIAAVRPADDREVNGLALNSRKVTPGGLYFACAGGRTHGIKFLDEAIRAGVAAVLYEPTSDLRDLSPEPLKTRDRQVPLIAVQGLADSIGKIAARFYGEPSSGMTVIGITGTNGKTSCCHYIAQALSSDGRRCGVIGTLGYGPYGALRQAEHTTPDAVTLQAEFAGMREAGVERVAMEVSSHALAQGRVNAVNFAVAVFTNLSHDHLDYHGDLEDYGLAKKKLFLVPGLRFAVINREDAFGQALISALPASVRCVEYGISNRPVTGRSLSVIGEIRGRTLAGLELHIQSSWGEAEFAVPLLGRFNAENVLATLAVLLALDMPLQEAVRRLSYLRAVPGRMERFGGTQARPLVIVDYAHTPDALEQVLSTLGDHPHGLLWCVFGCGGERDRTKRPMMGRIAARYADRIVLTNDNPRSEDPQAIFRDIQAGFPAGAPVEVIADRALAIRRAIEGAAGNDIVLVAGKGHEDYQLIGVQRRAFSDRAEVTSILGEAA